jgi:hypothetical protein
MLKVQGLDCDGHAWLVFSNVEGPGPGLYEKKIPLISNGDFK